MFQFLLNVKIKNSQNSHTSILCFSLFLIFDVVDIVETITRLINQTFVFLPLLFSVLWCNISTNSNSRVDCPIQEFTWVILPHQDPPEPRQLRPTNTHLQPSQHRLQAIHTHVPEQPLHRRLLNVVVELDLVDIHMKAQWPLDQAQEDTATLQQDRDLPESATLISVSKSWYTLNRFITLTMATQYLLVLIIFLENCV